MLDTDDIVKKKFIEVLHNAVAGRSRKLSAASGYQNCILENRAFKLFCADKTLYPRACADEMNFHYGTYLGGNDIINIFKKNRVNNPLMRAELLKWAEETVAAFVEALEWCNQETYDNYIALRKQSISTREGKPCKIHERILCLMLCVKHPELVSGDDVAAIEKFDTEYMRQILREVDGFLKDICRQDPRFVRRITLKDFLSALYVKYPELSVEPATLEKFSAVSLDKTLKYVRGFVKNNAPFHSGMTIEEFLVHDPDAQAMLIAPNDEAV